VSDDTTDAVAEAKLLVKDLYCYAPFAKTREASAMYERAAVALQAQAARIDDLETRACVAEREIARMRCGPKHATEAGSRYEPGSLVKHIYEVAKMVEHREKPARDRAKALYDAAAHLKALEESWSDECTHERAVSDLEAKLAAVTRQLDELRDSEERCAYAYATELCGLLRGKNEWSHDNMVDDGHSFVSVKSETQ